MQRKVVDYRKFRLNKINDPEFSHLKLIFAWVVYFFVFFLTEKFIPERECCVIYSPIDDAIPFCEWFVIPYVGWYLLIAGSLLYFLFCNVENFKRLQTFIIFVQFVAMFVYIIFPNRQDLRPDEFTRNNVLTAVVGWLYRADTNTNVCPSLHVAISIGIASMWLKENSIKAWIKYSLVAFCVLVCFSTVFIKQHSVIDGFAAMALCVLAEWIVCRKYWKEKIKHLK